MANTYTSATKLAKPAVNDTGWSTPVNDNADLIDALAPVGGLAVTTHETPSSSLLIDAAAGSFVVTATGAIVSYAGATSVAVTTAVLNYVYLTPSGTLTVNTTGFPATPHVRLATVLAGASTVTTVTDLRYPLRTAGAAEVLALTGGTMADAAATVVITCGATHGVQFGATGDKVGFLGTTPVVQQTLGAATASGTWTAAEQGMLQRVYNAVRAFGLGS